jgi:hypothetical protein
MARGSKDVPVRDQEGILQTLRLVPNNSGDEVVHPPEAAESNVLVTTAILRERGLSYSWKHLLPLGTRNTRTTIKRPQAPVNAVKARQKLRLRLATKSVCKGYFRRMFEARFHR